MAKKQVYQKMGQAEIKRQDTMKRKTEQQYAHVFEYILPDSEETKETIIISKSIPSACGVFAQKFKKAFILNMEVVPVDANGNTMEQFHFGVNLWNTLRKVVIKPEVNVIDAEIMAKKAQETADEFLGGKSTSLEGKLQ